MAQLRDCKTSELLAEGTPLELVLIAQSIGAAEICYDDVGEGFDPSAVLAYAEENADGLERTAADSNYPDDREAIQQAAADARAALTVDPDKLAEAQQLLEAARARLET